MSNTLIVFDVDSTLLSVESLDFAVERALASAPDGAERTRALCAITDQGMAGEIDFGTSLERRIAIAGLTRDSVADARQALRQHLTPGIADLLSALRAQGVMVQALSGGFIDLIAPAMADLGFADRDVQANRFVFDAEGAVVDFDRGRPTSRSGGKADAIVQLRADLGVAKTTIVGDGITDYEAFARGGADHFIGFGGVVAREAVKARAPVWAGSVAELGELLT